MAGKQAVRWREKKQLQAMLATVLGQREKEVTAAASAAAVATAAAGGLPKKAAAAAAPAPPSGGRHHRAGAVEPYRGGPGRFRPAPPRSKLPRREI